MGIISISFYKYYFYFIIFWILEFSSTFIKEFLDSIYADHKEVNLLFELLSLASLNAADLLSGIFVLITYFQSKSSKNNNNEDTKEKNTNKNTLETSLIYNDYSKRTNKYKLLMLISLLEFIGRFTDFFFFAIFGVSRIRGGEISWLISIDFLSRIIFSSLLLKSKLYTHHIITIILTIISLCSMSASAFIVIDKKDLGNWKYFFSVGLRFIVIPLEDILNKILFNEKFLLPHILMFYRGIFTAILFILLIPILILIKNHTKEDYFSLRHKEKQVNEFFQLFLVFTYIVFYSFRNFSIMKVIYFFSPQHVSFLIEVFYIFILLRCRIRAHDIKIVIITDLICLFIIVSSTLIFNEMVIINACGMNKHTKKSLILKESLENKDINLSINYEQNDNNENSLETSKSFEKSTECDF